MIRTGIEDYNKLLNLKENLNKEMAKLGRIRDLKVKFIDDKYQNKINKVVRDLEIIEGFINNAKAFVQKNKGDLND